MTDNQDPNQLDPSIAPNHEDQSPETKADSHPAKTKLEKFAQKANLIDEIEEEVLLKINDLVTSGYTDDLSTQTQWLQDTEDALKLARLTKEPKNTPLPQSANLKYPMIATASLQFAARTYPELIKDGKIVKAQVFGQSNPLLDLIADGVSVHMSHQLLGPDSEWETSMDKLLNTLPNIGFICKKTYYNTLKKKVCSDMCFYKDIILRNDPSIGCFCDLRRITHVLHIHPNDLVSGARAGIYDEDCVTEILNFYSANANNPECTLLEQHRFLDLDDDGYEEPYIVTKHKETNKIIRIYARYDEDSIQYTDDKKVLEIKPIQYFTDYHFLPAPDGSFMSVGFGSLLLHMNESVNTILNQLIDAGTLANLQTGFIDSRIKIMGGQMGVDPGTWTKVKAVIGSELKEGFYPVEYKEPSAVLYQLLGLVLNAAKELTSSTDAVQGLQNATNVPATSMMAMVEQGLKLYSAIQRRLYRGLKDEYQKVYHLNGRYLDEKEYIDLLGANYEAIPNIYKIPTIKVIPIADPNLSSDAQRLAQAQVIMSLAGKPGVDNHEVFKRLLNAANVSNVDKLLPKEKAQQANAPDPKMLEMHAKAQTHAQEVQIKSRAQDLKEKEFIAKLSKIEAEITKMQADSVKSVATAQQGQQNADTNTFNAHLQAVKTRLDSVANAHKQMTDAHLAAAKTNIQAQDIAQSHQENQQKMQIDQQSVDNQHEQAMTGLDNDQQQMQNDKEAQANEGQDNQSSSNDMDPSSDNSGNA